MELFVQQHELRSLLFELLAFGRVVRDGAISQVFDEMINPTWLIVDLLDFLEFLNTGSL